MSEKKSKPTPPGLAELDLEAAAAAAKGTRGRKRPTERTREEHEKEGYVVITGICGNLGRHLARALHKTEKIIGIDRRPFKGKPKDIEHYRLDLRRKACEKVFRAHPIKAVFHIGIMHDPRAKTREHHEWNITGTTKLLEYCNRYNIPKVVILSSANVYGPSPDNDTYLGEEAPLMAGARFSEIRDLIEMDMVAQSFFWRNPHVDTIILRPVHIVGREIRNAPSNYLRLDPIPTVMGFDPMVQVIHAEDLVRAMICCLQAKTRGVFNIAGPTAAPLSKIIAITGRRTLPVPGPLFDQWMKFAWKTRITNFPPPELDYIRYLCTVDGSRAEKELGFKPQYSLTESVRAIL
ncbi:MAG: hypothetical protein GMKNLPBB_02400 [Myxococcota bacterium]|nr:hypothetical protein [Myxococcota bacterium]